MALDNLINFLKRHRLSLKWAGYLLGGAILALLSINSYRFSSLKAHRVSPPDGIKIKLIPNTFRVETRQQFRLQAVTDFDENCPRIDAQIPDEQWQQSFRRDELLNGTQAQWNPPHTGTFRMQFFCNGRYLGDTGLSVVIRSDVGQKRVRKFKWVLSYGKPIYRDNAFFEVPIMASSEEQRGSAFLPSVVDKDTYLKMLDRNGQLSKIEPILIQRNTAISDPVYVPLPIGADYRLIAYEKTQGQSSNELAVAWTQLSPKLTLEASPSSVNLYSAAISSATVRLFLAVDDRQIKPSENMEVLLIAPSIIKADPSSGVSLTPDDPIGTYTLSSATQSGSWSVDFRQPKVGAITSATIHVKSVLWFSLTATLAGLLGVIVARQRALFAQEAWAIILELICAAAAAFLLHGMILAGWIKFPGAAEFMLGYLAAILLGLIGGYMGLGVFQLAKALIGKLF